MNKKGFAITPTEIIGLFIFVSFGIFLWFVYQGVFNFISEKGFSNPMMIGIGVSGLLGLLFLLKFKLLRFAIK